MKTIIHLSNHFSIFYLKRIELWIIVFWTIEHFPVGRSYCVRADVHRIKPRSSSRFLGVRGTNAWIKRSSPRSPCKIYGSHLFKVIWDRSFLCDLLSSSGVGEKIVAQHKTSPSNFVLAALHIVNAAAPPVLSCIPPGFDLKTVNMQELAMIHILRTFYFTSTNFIEYVPVAWSCG